MSPGVRAFLLALIVLTTGLGAVCLEVENVRCGVRIRRLLVEEEALREQMRRQEAEINKLLSPDVLTRDCPPDFRVVRESEVREEKMPARRWRSGSEVRS